MSSENFTPGQLMPLDAVLGRLAGEFVFIPAGEFLMGSATGRKHELPVHRVILTRSIEMGRHQVTQWQWQTVMSFNRSYFNRTKQPVADTDLDRLPVEKVTWLEVMEFIDKLNQQSQDYCYRLPTEAEWEYAARAGALGDFDGELDDIAWYEWTSRNKTHPVGRKQPNNWGLYDMAGNVWEWCSDWFDYYDQQGRDETDPQGPGPGPFRVFHVIRGGGWESTKEQCRWSHRYYERPHEYFDDTGFRLVRIKR